MPNLLYFMAQNIFQRGKNTQNVRHAPADQLAQGRSSITLELLRETHQRALRVIFLKGEALAYFNID